MSKKLGTGVATSKISEKNVYLFGETGYHVVVSGTTEQQAAFGRHRKIRP
ncbi:hypothetical protein [Pontibacter anaerobius]|uniref:Uncharacterized protein n=1 Tax=Pontibacter anaerobius TaxID=2993940 RepID=A0ABT3RBQ3_9BACT|nr:hypothetical protein [Pontibacter anaerobius]MCX2738823.1 hypothetical protein [Pontibacter anaerobius]